MRKLCLKPISLFNGKDNSQKVCVFFLIHWQLKEVSIESDNNEIVLGRGDITGIDDKKLSRKQVMVTFRNGNVFAKFIGMNVSYIFPQGKIDAGKPMEKEKEYELKSEDVLSLLPTMYSFQLKQIDGVALKSSELLNGEVQKLINGKRSIDLSNNGDVQSIPKKAKVEESVSLQNEELELEEKLKQLYEIFPQENNVLLKKALIETANNIEKAIEYILNPQHSSSGSNNTSSTSTTTDSIKKTTSTIMTPTQETKTITELQSAYTEIEELAAKRKKAEDEAKAQDAIIKLLLEEKQAAEKKSIELQKIAVELDRLYLPGEREALEGTIMKKYELLPQRSFENDANILDIL